MRGVVSWLLRLAHSEDSERGAAFTFVALSTVVLFGFVAFAFDFGRMYSERRELQSGADAAALAVAHDCAFGDCSGGYDPFAEAEVYADANASDGLAWVEDIDLDLAAQQVTVHTATEDVGGDHFFDMTFAPVVGYDGLTVAAEATVAWGSPAGLPTLPLTFSGCEWQDFGDPGFVEDGPTNFLHHAAAADGQFPPASGYAYADRYAQIFFHGNHECHYSPSGQDLPGGFGWLDTTGGCQSDTDVGDWVSADPGASPSNGCSSSFMESLVGEVVLIPYFDDYRGTGNNAEYHVAGFGALYVTGFNFGGQYKEPSLISGGNVCSGSDRCIEGYFIGDWVAPGGGIGGPDYGVIVIQFVG